MLYSNEKSNFYMQEHDGPHKHRVEQNKVPRMKAHAMWFQLNEIHN